ncbi:MAG: tRNA lysidine(34) synthetase TilS [Terracidiphilus sp.]
MAASREVSPSRYHPLVPRSPKSKPVPNTAPGLPLDATLLKPGMRLAVALSGGADSVALLRALAGRRQELGLVLHAAHLHHGLRGEEADGDLEFCRELAAKLEIPFHEARVDMAAEARANAKTGKPAETIEEAARRLRYSWFQQLLSKSLLHAVVLDAVATAHTLDDQAETVLAKFLRGAWTEGLAGISPKLESPEGLEGPEGGGAIVRPLLDTKRSEIEAYLNALGQPWREDSTNRDLTFTRNRIRHELLPLLEGWNPRLREHLAQMAELAQDEEAWWQAELARLAAQLILPGRPARGGGRAAGEGSVAIEVSRLAALAPAVQRRLVRHAAQQFGAALDFAATEAVRSLALCGRAGQRLALPQGLRAERTARELRFSVAPEPAAEGKSGGAPQVQYTVAIPGDLDAPEFGVRLRIALTNHEALENGQEVHENGRVGGSVLPQTATLRNWKPGDRVRLRYSSGLRKVKEVLERKHVTGTERVLWPVLEAGGRVVWMKGVELEREPGLAITAVETAPEASQPALPSR